MRESFKLSERRAKTKKKMSSEMKKRISLRNLLIHKTFSYTYK